jgi:hypothetical protein
MFVGWAKKPETIQREQENESMVKSLLERTDDLSEWEREFITSLKRQLPRLSPKQEDKLYQIHQKLNRVPKSPKVKKVIEPMKFSTPGDDEINF